jgi:hypothetical protein
VAQTAKHVADTLNRCLDHIDAPNSVRERATILGKILDIPKHEARAFLEGQQIPPKDLLMRIATEFEIDPRTLSGDNEKKQR